MGFKLAGLCPYVELTDLIVGETTCDGKKKAYEIFNDITKKDYPASLPVIEDKLRPGGVLIVDNMLWNRRVMDPGEKSADAEGVREMTRRLLEPAWISSLVPIRDGLLIALKR